MKKKNWGVYTVMLGVLVAQNVIGQPLHAKDQISTELLVSSEDLSLETPDTSEIAENTPPAESNTSSSIQFPNETTEASTELEPFPESTTESSIESSSPMNSSETTASSSQVRDSSTATSDSSISTETSMSEPNASESSSSDTSSSNSDTLSTASTSLSSDNTTETKTESSREGGSSSSEQKNNSTENNKENISDKSKKIGTDLPSARPTGIVENRFPKSKISKLLSENDRVLLDKKYKVSEISESDLKGFELPLLKKFEDKTKAILIYEGVKHVGQYKINSEINGQSQEITVHTMTNLMDTMLKDLVGQSLDKIQKLNVSNEKKQAGDLLYKNKQLFGLYLGGDYYLKVGKPTTKEITDNPDLANQKVIKLELFSDNDTLANTIEVQRLVDCKLTDYGRSVEKSYPASMNFSENVQTHRFIQSIAKSAQKLGADYDVFASVMIAQAILESGSGTSVLSLAPNHNLFGVKGSYQGNSVSFNTQEDRGNGELYTIQAAFRRYPSYSESLGDYVALIRGGIQGNRTFYQDAWRSTAKNYLRAADSLTGTYATDTMYNRKISSLIATYHLTQYDGPESSDNREATSAILQEKENIPEVYRKAMPFPDYDGKNYNSSGSYPVGQCTWYAYNRVAQLGKHVDNFMGNGGEWGTTAKRLGYTTSQEPQVGWLVSFSPGTAGSSPIYGHVAFVEAVTSQGILISEGNVLGGTIISYRIIPNSIARSELVTYVEPR